jgi:hypothetical protein
LKEFSIKLKKNKKKSAKIWDSVLPKKRLKCSKKSKDNASEFEITYPEEPKLFDEYFANLGSIFESFLIKLSLNYREQQKHLGNSMQEFAYYMSKGNRLDKEHFDNNWILSTIGFYCLIESTLKFVESRTIPLNCNPYEFVYYFPLIKRIHKQRKNYFGIYINALPHNLKVFFFKQDMVGQLQFKKLHESHRIHFYYLGLQNFYVDYYKAMSILARYLFVNDLLGSIGVDNFKRNYKARSKAYNKGFLFRFKEFDKELEKINKFKEYQGGKITITILSIS